jgi:hypothetical protein
MVFFTVHPFPESDSTPPARQLWPFLGLLGLLCGAGAALTQLAPARDLPAQPIAITQVPAHGQPAR